MWRLTGTVLVAAYLIAVVLVSRRLRRRVAAAGPLPQAHANVRWLTESEGGRPELPEGPEYFATAVFAARVEDAPAGVCFSVGLVFPEGTASSTEPRAAGVRFLDIERVRERLVPGATFFVMEPPRPVAIAMVTRIFPINY